MDEYRAICSGPAREAQQPSDQPAPGCLRATAGDAYAAAKHRACRRKILVGALRPRQPLSGKFGKMRLDACGEVAGAELAGLLAGGLRARLRNMRLDTRGRVALTEFTGLLH